MASKLVMTLLVVAFDGRFRAVHPIDLTVGPWMRTHPVKAADGMMFRLLSPADLSSNSTAGVRRAWMLDGH
jgi:hypothetical protein